MHLATVTVKSIVFGLALSAGLATSQAPRQQEVCSSSLGFSTAREEAHTLLASGHNSEALAPLERALVLCPDESVNARELASVLIEAGDTGYAETLLRELIARKDEAELHSLLGRALTRDKSYRDATAQYQVAATMEPSETHIFDFGTALMKVNFGAATEILQYGVKSYPASVKMHVGLALALYAQDRSEEGAQLLCAASALNPVDPLPMEVLADTKMVPKSLQAEAASRLAELRLRHPDNGLLLFDYALVTSGRLSGDRAVQSPEFIALLQKAVALDPKLAKAHFELALVYEEDEKYLSEITELKRAIHLTPGIELFHYRLAFAYRATGDMTRFREELARYRSLHSSAEASH